MIAIYIAAITLLATITLWPLAVDAAALLATAWSINAQPVPLHWGTLTNRRK